jgi:2-dehydro-3-deoxyphosphooctonate aldolase (KDO 8-P synthase)
MQEVKVNKIKIGGDNPLVLIAGPCVMEEETSVLEIAQSLVDLSFKYGIPFIFKASYEKDNRGSEKSYNGPGLEKGLEILFKIKEKYNIPVLSDVHRQEDVEPAAEVLDIIQIPAYLCQQTSLLLKAAKTQKPINVKKGQFLAPENMISAVKKIESVGNKQILLTERGSCFGYNRLISDMCAIPIMQNLGYPVVFDSTHILRIYGISSSDPRGGLPQFIPHLTRAAVAVGCDAVFIETHPQPRMAKCDAASMLPLDLLSELLKQILAIREALGKSGGN